jgi:hypothetical protein
LCLRVVSVASPEPKIPPWGKKRHFRYFCSTGHRGHRGHRDDTEVRGESHGPFFQRLILFFLMMFPRSLRLTSNKGYMIATPGGKIKGSYSRTPLLNSCIGCKFSLRLKVSEIQESNRFTYLTSIVTNLASIR